MGTPLEHLQPDSAKSSGVNFLMSLGVPYQSIGYFSLTFAELPEISFM